ncbi:MAG TPA: MoaD/ThiS family protein [Ferruginibacter sp.]|jgi:molybdopterin synthase sulfur carrier subunit|nr:MoaD/ThiS family protein [Ferruginibacter sp.]
MQVNISIFGPLTDIITKDNLVINDINDTNTLTEQLNKTYPALATIKYAIAVNKNIITNNTILNDNDTVALMPPFSGG